jgi:hypothetical protein
MTFDAFFAEVRENNLSVDLPAPNSRKYEPLDNDALFHLPLLAMTVLMLSKARSKPRVERLGQLVGECMERTFVGFVGSAKLLGWSASLRVRTVQALTFLEMTGLVTVDGPEKSICITKTGTLLLNAALKDGSDLGYTLSRVARAQRSVYAELKLSMESE